MILKAPKPVVGRDGDRLQNAFRNYASQLVPHVPGVPCVVPVVSVVLLLLLLGWGGAVGRKLLICSLLWFNVL